MTTSIPPVFDLAPFLTPKRANGLTTRIGIPRYPFRLRPGSCTEPLNLMLHQKLWWLVRQDVVKHCPPPKIISTPLYEGVYRDGRTILIPLADQMGQMQDWGVFLEAALRKAERTWVKIETNYYDQCDLSEPWITANPNWSGCTLPELVCEAFENQTIETVEQYYSMCPKPILILEEDI